MIDSLILIEIIDGYLVELGTTSLVDARVARNQLMDLRLFCMASLTIPDTIESIAPLDEVV